MCQYTVTQYTFRNCRAQPKHMFEDHTRVDYVEGLRDEEGALVPDPCPNPKLGRGSSRMCAEAKQAENMLFGSSSNRGRDTPCSKCLEQGLFVDGPSV